MNGEQANDLPDRFLLSSFLLSSSFLLPTMQFTLNQEGGPEMGGMTI